MNMFFFLVNVLSENLVIWSTGLFSVDEIYHPWTLSEHTFDDWDITISTNKKEEVLKLP